jgi:hypothetical protein
VGGARFEAIGPRKWVGGGGFEGTSPRRWAGGADSVYAYENNEENANTWDPIINGVRHEFQDNTWSQDFFTYDPKPREFFGLHGPHSFFAGIPTLL